MNQHQKAMNFLSESILFLVFRGILVGLLAGSVVSLFRFCIQELSEGILSLYALAHQSAVYLGGIALAYLLILVLVGHLMATEPHIKGSGIPQIEAELKGFMHLDWWSVLWKKFLAGILTISSGMLLGREGPSIQLGAMVGKGVAERLRLTSFGEKTLIASGSAAGIAAAFGAPIAGLLFVVEEVYHHFSRTVWITTLAASLTADLVSKRVFGMAPVLGLATNLGQLPLTRYWVYVLMGLLFGGLAYTYEKIILMMGEFYQRLGSVLHLSPTYYSLIPLIMVMPLAYYLPVLVGGGHDIIVSLPNLEPRIGVFLAWFVIRFVYCMICYGSGVPGGIFLPILSLGALSGATFGALALWLGAIESSQFSLFVIAGMCAYFGAVSKAPLTAIVLVCEMVGNLSQLMPLAVVTLASYTVMDLLKGAPIYEAMLEKLLVGKDVETSEKLMLLQWPVTEKIAGKQVFELELPRQILITNQVVNGKSELVSGSTKLYLGNTIDILIRESDRKLVEDYLL
ncbi:ClC family H(+)/Cl(-) exchange transporter [Streptococcus hyovaginalis]|uniref:ClC family H(+)/Cl(-) exchange transporter n=1 Tax=Streptococcus hyovaginalis TaxID=149015 RepID=UPI002A82E52E|nr:ClC family H(+)/Cl(-) exchange transporter [Streptococcus hyovaginalis]MDY4511334.1 ClC family H(+)/Cl(-) exchange transporter [Streptococcus hyovaginalis]